MVIHRQVYGSMYVAQLDVRICDILNDSAASSLALDVDPVARFVQCAVLEGDVTNACI